MNSNQLQLSNIKFQKTGIFLKNKLTKDAMLLFFGRGAIFVVGVFSTLIYGIIFAKQQIAVISLFEMVINLFLSFGFTWSSTGIVRFGKEELLHQGVTNYVSSTRLTLISPILLISALLLISFRHSVLDYIGVVNNTIIVYLIINLGLMVLHEHITSILQTAEMHFSNVVFFIIQSIGKLCILAAFFRGLIEVSPVMYFKLNVYLLLLLFFFRILLIKKEYIFPVKIPKKSDFSKFFRFVFPQILGFGGLYLINWVDIYFIRISGNLADLGAYQFLYSIFTKLGSFAVLVSILFFPKVMTWKSRNSEALEQYLRKGPYIVFIIMSCMISILCIFYNPIFSQLFKEKYIIAYPSFNILLWTLPFYFVTFLFIPVLNSYDKVGYIQATNIVSAFVNLFIDYLLIKNFGIIAAALGTFVAYFTKYLFLIICVQKMFNQKYGWLLFGSSLTFLSVFIYLLIKIGCCTNIESLGLQV